MCKRLVRLSELLAVNKLGGTKMNDSANNAQNSNLKKRTKQLSAAARAIQTRKRNMLTELYYARAFLMRVRDDST